MWTNVIEVTAPMFDDDAGFDAVAKPLDGQTFVSELAIEAFIGAVLPGFAGIDERGFDVRVGEPLEKCVADEFRTIVRAQVARRPVRGDQTRENFDDATRADGARHIDGQALPGKLVDHGQAFELLSVGSAVTH